MVLAFQNKQKIGRILKLLQLQIAILAIKAKLIARKGKNKKRQTSKRQWWVRPQWLRRSIEGEYHTAMQVMRQKDPQSFKSHYRMSPAVFDRLVSLIGIHIQKSDKVRQSLSPEERLAITIRYLASGDAIKSIALAFLIGKETARTVIYDTCAVLYNILQPLYLPSPTRSIWKTNAHTFCDMWQYPNCMGCADRKHVNIQCPPRSGSQYSNFKGSFSLELMAITDASYKFVYVDVEDYGQRSDGATFSASTLGQALCSNQLDIPSPIPLPHTNIMCPYVFLGDESFQLTTNFMQPFPGKQLNREQQIFNYRLSRARRCMENTFGILASRWQIYRRPLNILPVNVDNIVLATIVLHNFLCSEERNQRPTARTYIPLGYADIEDSRGNWINGQWRAQLDHNPPHGLTDVTGTSAKSPKLVDRDVRELFVQYFSSAVGAVSLQQDYVHVPNTLH